METVFFSNRGINRREKSPFNSVLIKQPRHHREINSAFSLLSWKLLRHLNSTIYCPLSRERYLKWKELSSWQINKIKSIRSFSVCVPSFNNIWLKRGFYGALLKSCSLVSSQTFKTKSILYFHPSHLIPPVIKVTNFPVGLSFDIEILAGCDEIKWYRRDNAIWFQRHSGGSSFK